MDVPENIETNGEGIQEVQNKDEVSPVAGENGQIEQNEAPTVDSENSTDNKKETALEENDQAESPEKSIHDSENVGEEEEKNGEEEQKAEELFKKFTIPDDVICERFEELNYEEIVDLLMKIKDNLNRNQRIQQIAKFFNGYNKNIINGIVRIKEQCNDNEIYADQLYGALQIINWTDDNRMNVKTPLGEYKSHYPSKSGKYSCKTKNSALLYEVFTSWSFYVSLFAFLFAVILALLFLTPFSVKKLNSAVFNGMIALVTILCITCVATFAYFIYSYIKQRKHDPSDTVYEVNNLIDDMIAKSHKEIVSLFPEQTTNHVIKKLKLKNPTYTELFGNFLIEYVIKPQYNHLFFLLTGKLTQPEHVKDMPFETFENIFTCYRFCCSGHFKYDHKRTMYKLFSRFFVIYLVNSPLEVHEKLIRFAQLDSPYDPMYSCSKGLFLYKNERDQIIPTLRKLYKIIKNNIDNYDKDMPEKMKNIKHIISGNRMMDTKKMFGVRLKIFDTLENTDEYSISDLDEEEEEERNEESIGEKEEEEKNYTNNNEEEEKNSEKEEEEKNDTNNNEEEKKNSEKDEKEEKNDTNNNEEEKKD